MKPMPDEEALVAALAAHPRHDLPALDGRADRDTGVLVPLLAGETWTCVLTERPQTMRRHAGEVCFPGGLPEPSDADLRATALREAQEELGLRSVRLLGKLSSIPLATSAHRLHPFVGVVREDEIDPSADEVARLVRYSLPELLARPQIDAIHWENGARGDLAPVFETGGRMLFGATAYVLYELLLALAPAFGTTAPPRVTGRFAWSDVL